MHGLATLKSALLQSPTTRSRRTLVGIEAYSRLAVFAGLWTNWTLVRKVKEGETTNDVFAFLTTESNHVVGTIHPKAMPVILTKPDEIETWMTGTPEEALTLQRPLAGGTLRIVARGTKEDGVGG
jgi:putative SOS response-associated peptidase YedK